MKRLVSMAAALACAFALDAQITTTLSGQPDGYEQVTVRNNSQKSLIAFVVSVQRAPDRVNMSKAPLVVYCDPLVELTAKPLLLDEERVVLMIGGTFRDRAGKPPLPGRAGDRLRILSEPIAAAGVFVDGATTGDAVLLTRLMLRRSNMLLAVETALETLSNAGRRNQPKDQLIGQFRKMADSLDRGYLPPEQRIGRNLYTSIAERLSALTEGPLGTPFPPTSFIEQEIAPLRQQRVALLESQPSLIDATPIEHGIPPQRALQSQPPAPVKY